jgi:hypothetical protein
MMVVVMVVAPPVAMVVMVMIGELDISLGWLGRLCLVHCLQPRRSVRNRLQQFSK